jgi:hypothetical protein
MYTLSELNMFDFLRNKNDIYKETMEVLYFF